MKVAVTGWAWRVPLGNVVDAAVNRLLAGERAAQKDARFPTGTYSCSLGAAIRGGPATGRGRRFLPRMARFAVEAALEALEQSGLSVSDRTGIYCGVGGIVPDWDEIMPALVEQRDDGADSWNRGLRGLHPFWMLKYLSNNALAQLANETGARGEGINFGGLDGGAQALCAATLALKTGAVDAAVVLAYDTRLQPEILAELGGSQAACTTDLGLLAAPYDTRANGFVPGEAAAALVLQAQPTRPAIAWVEAAVAVEHDRLFGAGFAKSVGKLVHRNEVIDGAALGTREIDRDEREALSGIVAEDTPLVATAAAMGHVGAASSLVQLIAMGACLRRRTLPVIAGMRTPASGPLCPVETTASTGVRAAVCLGTQRMRSVSAVRVEVP